MQNRTESLSAHHPQLGRCIFSQHRGVENSADSFRWHPLQSSKLSTSHPARIGDRVRRERFFLSRLPTRRPCKYHRPRVLNGTLSSGRLEKTRANNNPAHHGLGE